MKKSIQNNYHLIKILAFAGLFAISSMLTATAQSDFAVYLKTENNRTHWSSEGKLNIETNKLQRYIIWNIENDTYRTIYLNPDDGTFISGRDREWQNNETVEDEDTGKIYSILSEFDFVGDIDGDIYSGYLKGQMIERVIENGPNARRALIAKTYRGKGHDQWSLDPAGDRRYWRVSVFHMLYLDELTRSLNSKKFNNVKDAQSFVAEFLEGQGWRQSEER